MKSLSNVTLSGTFHELNRVLSEDQQVLGVSAGTRAHHALALMEQHGFSQLPVTTRRRVVGLFSFRSFALAASSPTLRGLPADLAVEDAMEAPHYYRITEDIATVVPVLDAHGVILVGTPEQLDGLITAADVMRYLQEVAQPYLNGSDSF